MYFGLITMPLPILLLVEGNATFFIKICIIKDKLLFRLILVYITFTHQLFPDFRCKCNGHANSCELVPRNETVIITAEDGSQQTQTANIEIMECKCEHGTDGPNCEMCLPDHNSRPWKRAEQDNAHECRRKY